MGTSEKAMKYVNRITEIENKFTAVGHMVRAAERKRVLIRSIHE